VRVALEGDDLAQIGRRGIKFVRREDLGDMVDAAVAVIEAVAKEDPKSEIRNPKS
jgi:hypothetical protein